VTAVRAGAQRVAEPARTPFLPWEEWHGWALHESARFGDLKRGCMPEIEMLCHRPSEQGVWTESRETGVIDCFSLRVH